MPDVPTWKLEITYTFRELLAGVLPSDDLDAELCAALMPPGMKIVESISLDRPQLEALGTFCLQRACDCHIYGNVAGYLEWSRFDGVIGKLLRTQPDGVRRSEPAAAVSVAPRQASLFDLD